MSGLGSLGRLLGAVTGLGAQEVRRALEGDPEVHRRLDRLARESAQELGPTAGRMFRAINALLGGGTDLLRSRSPVAARGLVDTWEALNLSGVEVERAEKEARGGECE